jgi:hypothetical protein
MMYVFPSKWWLSPIQYATHLPSGESLQDLPSGTNGRPVHPPRGDHVFARTIGVKLHYEFKAGALDRAQCTPQMARSYAANRAVCELSDIQVSQLTFNRSATY